jgi:pantetheine-phosphate adenylyltransferase
MKKAVFPGSFDPLTLGHEFEFEKAIAHTNRKLSKIETVFLLTAAKTSYISSSIVRDVIRNGGEYEKLVPDAVRVKE